MCQAGEPHLQTLGCSRALVHRAAAGTWAGWSRLGLSGGDSEGHSCISEQAPCSETKVGFSPASA